VKYLLAFILNLFELFVTLFQVKMKLIRWSTSPAQKHTHTHTHTHTSSLDRILRN